jgi:hypothetical protein
MIYTYKIVITKHLLVNNINSQQHKHKPERMMRSYMFDVIRITTMVSYLFEACKKERRKLYSEKWKILLINE